MNSMKNKQKNRPYHKFQTRQKLKVKLYHTYMSFKSYKKKITLSYRKDAFNHMKQKIINKSNSAQASKFTFPSYSASITDKKEPTLTNYRPISQLKKSYNIINAPKYICHLQYIAVLIT